MIAATNFPGSKEAASRSSMSCGFYLLSSPVSDNGILTLESFYPESLVVSKVMLFLNLAVLPSNDSTEQGLAKAYWRLVGSMLEKGTNQEMTQKFK